MTLQTRLAKLEVRSPAREVGRLFFLLPNLWPENDKASSEIESGEALADLAGVRPVLRTSRIWAIITAMSQEARTWDEPMKATFLETHETRPLAPWQRRERH
jgi:hypothetical protein